MTVVMQEYGMSLQDASTYLGKQYAELMNIYMDAKAHLQARSSGDEQLDADIKHYIEGLEFWPIGNIVSKRVVSKSEASSLTRAMQNWCFETTRYFARPDEVQRTKLVVLRECKASAQGP